MYYPCSSHMCYMSKIAWNKMHIAFILWDPLLRFYWKLMANMNIFSCAAELPVALLGNKITSVSWHNWGPIKGPLKPLNTIVRGISGDSELGSCNTERRQDLGQLCLGLVFFSQFRRELFMTRKRSTRAF